MKRVKIGVCFAMLLAAMLMGSAAARAQVMSQVPANALVVIKVNNVKGTSDKIAKLAQDLGIAALPGMEVLADPLAALQAQTKMQNGLDTAGELAFVFVDPDTAGGDPEQSMFLLVPVSDYKAFLGNWPGAKTEGEISEVPVGEGNPKPGYVANWGKYAAFSPSKTAIAAKPSSALKSPAIASKELSAKDIVLYANFVALKAKLAPHVKEGRVHIAEEIERNLRNNVQVAKFIPAIKTLVNQVMNVPDEFLNDTQAATVGLGITPEGINATVVSEFTAGSYIANTIGSLKNTDASLLEGIPTGKYLVYGGSVGDPQATAKLFSDFADPILKDLLAVGPEMKAAQDWSDSMKVYISSMRGQTFGMVAPTGAVGAEPLIQMVAVQTGDPQSLMASYTKMLDAQQSVMKALNIPGADAVVPAHTSAAKEVDGVKFDQIITKVDPNAQGRAAMQQAQMMAMLYGPQGAVVNYGAVGDKLLITTGVPDSVVSAAIASVKGKTAPLADNDKVKTVAAQLPKSRTAVVYIPVDDIVSTGLSYAKQFGFAMNVQLPPDLPPVGVTLGTEATAIRIDAHIPTTLVQSLVAAGMQAAMQMQGGGPRGGGL